METSSSEKLILDASQQTDVNVAKISWFEILGGIVISPAKTFKYLSVNPEWGLLSVIILLGLLVPNGLRTFVYIAIEFLSVVGGEMSEFDPILAEPIAMLFVPLGVAIFLILDAAILFLIIRLCRANLPFWSLVPVYAYATWVPTLLRDSLEKIISFLTGNPTWPGVDLKSGLLQLFDNSQQPIALLRDSSFLDLFGLWSFVLVIIIVQAEAKVSWNRAVLIAVINSGIGMALGITIIAFRGY